MHVENDRCWSSRNPFHGAPVVGGTCGTTSSTCRSRSGHGRAVVQPGGSAGGFALPQDLLSQDVRVAAVLCELAEEV